MAAQLRAIKEQGPLREINVQPGQSSVFKYALDDKIAADLDYASIQSATATVSHQEAAEILTDAAGRSLIKPLMEMKTVFRDDVWHALEIQRQTKPRFAHKPLTQEIVDTFLEQPFKAVKLTLNSGTRTRFVYLYSGQLETAIRQHSVRPFLELLSAQEAAEVRVNWAGSKKVSPQEDSGFPLSQVQEVLGGRVSEAFKQVDQKKRPGDEAEKRSMTLRTAERTLDLEFQEARAARGFRAAVEYMLAFGQ